MCITTAQGGIQLKRKYPTPSLLYTALKDQPKTAWSSNWRPGRRQTLKSTTPLQAGICSRLSILYSITKPKSIFFSLYEKEELIFCMRTLEIQSGLQELNLLKYSIIICLNGHLPLYFQTQRCPGRSVTFRARSCF